MDNSLILLAVIALSAVGLVPHAVRRREQLSSCRSADRFSESMRVLHRKNRSSTTRPGVTVAAGRRPVLLASPCLDAARPGPGPAGGRPLSTVAVRVVHERVPGRAFAQRVLGGWALGSLLAVAGCGGLLVSGQAPGWLLALAGAQLTGAVVVLRLRARRVSSARRALAEAAARRYLPTQRPVPGQLAGALSA